MNEPESVPQTICMEFHVAAYCLLLGNKELSYALMGIYYSSDDNLTLPRNHDSYVDERTTLEDLAKLIEACFLDDKNRMKGVRLTWNITQDQEFYLEDSDTPLIWFSLTREEMLELYQHLADRLMPDA